MKNWEPEVTAAQADINFDTTTYQIQLDTSMGTILIDLYPDLAPGHCKNIIGLSKVGYYDGLIFHRVIAGFMIQGGCPLKNGTGNPGYTIDAEFSSKDHIAGTLSMARTADPNSAGSQFFLCLDRVPHLDNQYTVFGQADAAGTEVIKAIGGVRTNAQDRPLEEVSINKATVIETAK